MVESGSNTNGRDHPRMCGDHIVAGGGRNDAEGSPPHVRGPLTNGTLLIGNSGITPACAGTTILFILNPPNMWDHPRMCGDHVFVAMLVCF